jgi:hypothetical protein
MATVKDLIPRGALLEDGGAFKRWSLSGMVTHTYNPSKSEVEIGRIAVEGQPWTKCSQTPISTNKSRDVAQVVEHLPSKHMALCSNSSTAKTINK